MSTSRGDEINEEDSRRITTRICDDLSVGQRAFAAAGAAFISAIIVNPLDIAKTRLQAQAAGVPYHGLCPMESLDKSTLAQDLKCIPRCDPVCSQDCFRYKGTLDVFYKVTRQEGFATLWRGTYASLALSIPTVAIYLPCYDIFRNHLEGYTTQNTPKLTPYIPLIAGSLARSIACISCYPIELARTRMQALKEVQAGVKLPGVWKTLLGVIAPVRGSSNLQTLQNSRILWTGLGAQLARDVPFSGICWSTLEPMKRRILSLMGDETNIPSVVAANFGAGVIAGSVAAAATCPLDVAKTRRQIEKDPTRALQMTTRQTLLEILGDGGIRGLFTGIGPRVGRAGPSVGIVVSFYEVVKYVICRRCQNERYLPV